MAPSEQVIEQWTDSGMEGWTSLIMKEADKTRKRRERRERREKRIIVVSPNSNYV